MWSLGCCLAELVLHQPLFPGQSDINQLELIFKTIGYPVHIVLFIATQLVRCKRFTILYVVPIRLIIEKIMRYDPKY